LRKIILTASLLVFIDQIIKVWIKTNMFLGQEHVIFDWFIIHFIENNGMAFGLEFGGVAGKAILSVFRIIVVIIGVKYLSSLDLKIIPLGGKIALGLILGGAIGNIIDSTFYGLLFNDSFNNIATFGPEEGGYAPLLHGKVVDMLYFPIINTHLNGEHFIFFRPVFNIADAGISIGVFLILLFYRNIFS
jgi:signal peptidase II